ncbi:hypothetical protein [Advenella sp. FME57]|uniref:hypothetical protein n=1 Tax=Advenella sp. FME57 TaxID=2742604 RepID=UPI0018673D4E|nr:hypothetical protein [Advenella sp. FME57]
MTPVAFAYEILAADKEKVISLFGIFSRLEYSLKKAGYRRKNLKYLACDWRSFSKSAVNELKQCDAPLFLAAVDLLVDKFPRQQNIDMTWDDKTPPFGSSRIEIAINSSVRIRNNLFHGGKDDFRNFERNNQLIDAAIVVLSECSNINEIQHYYYGATNAYVRAEAL